MDLNREHFRAMIFYDFRSSLKEKECIQRLRAAFGDKAPSEKTVYNWYNEFRRNRSILRDESRKGRPRTAVTDESVSVVRHMIEDDARITYNTIRASLGIGMSQIQNILHNCLKVKKLCCRWIPHALTAEQKQSRVNWCKETLTFYHKGRSNSVYNIITGDESWIYSFEPERKRQSAQWVFLRIQNQQKLSKVVALGRK